MNSENGRGRAVGYDIEIIDRNAIGTYPVEYMADGSDVKRRLTTRDIEMLDMPDMPQQGAYMFQRNIHMLGVSPHTVGTAHVAAPGNLDRKIFNIELFHVRHLEVVLRDVLYFSDQFAESLKECFGI